VGRTSRQGDEWVIIFQNYPPEIDVTRRGIKAIQSRKFIAEIANGPVRMGVGTNVRLAEVRGLKKSDRKMNEFQLIEMSLAVDVVEQYKRDSTLVTEYLG
jgi:hypothetical protein